MLLAAASQELGKESGVGESRGPVLGAVALPRPALLAAPGAGAAGPSAGGPPPCIGARPRPRDPP